MNSDRKAFLSALLALLGLAACSDGDFHLRLRLAINAPLGVAVLIYGCFRLPQDRVESPGPFDAPGFILASVGVACSYTSSS